MLRCPADGISLARDDFGRPVSARPPASAGWPPDARLFLAVGDDADRPLLALARDLPVALSVHTVPRGPLGELLLPFTPLERASLRQVPAADRARQLTRLWARKEAVLRLAGRGGLAVADEIDALSGAPDGDGTVLLPPSLAAAGGACGPVVYVRDLPAGPDRVACVATSAPARGVRLWDADSPAEAAR
ncbi:4'-phosphopantetheinyl transferase superfamily protein [Streptomyces sp. NPDC093097]|uniref:4'-phosphopantetheinyl transferase superfamily protein n=1 Tax=Streptomyces sp. NPDC093097 TaxID=3366027 RepID=UPI0038133A3C